MPWESLSRAHTTKKHETAKLKREKEKNANEYTKTEFTSRNGQSNTRRDELNDANTHMPKRRQIYAHR